MSQAIHETGVSRIVTSSNDANTGPTWGSDIAAALKYRLCRRRFISWDSPPETSSTLPVAVTPRSVPGFLASTISEAFGRAITLRAFLGLGRRRDEQTAILEEIPDRSQVDGSICVLGSECCNVASSQEIVEIRVQFFASPFALRRGRPIRQRTMLLLVLASLEPSSWGTNRIGLAAPRSS